MRVLDPIARERGKSTELAPRPNLVKGARIGLLSNGKPNADVLLEVINSRVEQAFPKLGPPIVLNKGTHARGPGDPASEEQYRELSSGAIAVLAASGD